jgi:alginate O-acetyltransferase complex protein AlgI
MVFNSFNFLIFFPLITVFYWITPAKYRWVTLLIASYFFYINIKPVFAILLVGVTASTYLFTRLIDGTNAETRKKTFMIINIVLIILPLFFFKYLVVINIGLIELLGFCGKRWLLPDIKLILPIGISFYTFMAIGYTIDVYNEEIKIEKNIGILALFISFFPLILSGPIERAKNMFPQYKSELKLDYGLVVDGLKLMLWGYFMKLVVADRLGIYIDAVYGNIQHSNGTSLFLASVLYPFQVYADLGGYSLIAIGTAKTLGINVMQNFKRPFFATSMSEFWRRWHISLISWLTDYVYTPLSFTFRKLKIWGIVIALMITFFISGIWHGAALTFIAWGILQGVFLSIESLTNKKKATFENKHKLSSNTWYKFAGMLLTFILFAVSQVFGRSPELSDALLVFSKILKEHGSPYIDMTTLLYSALTLSILLISDYYEEFYPERIKLFRNKNIVVRFASYLIVIFMIILLGVFGGEKFIYFQF